MNLTIFGLFVAFCGYVFAVQQLERGAALSSQG